MKKLLALPCIISLQIALAQNVGIGTTIPGAKLHVVNNSSGFSGSYLPGAAIENNQGVYVNLFSPSAYESGLLFGNASAAAHGGIIYNNPSARSGLQFRTNGNVTRMVLDSFGNVGIGTIAPGEKLTIVSGDNNSVTNIGTFYPNNLTQGIGIGYDEIRKIGTNPNGNLYLNAKGSGNLILQNSAIGNVGIGVMPEQNLSIRYGMNIDQGNGNNGALDNNVLRFGGGGSGEAITSPRTGGSNNQYGLDFYTASSKRMVITSGGNVGIATTSPQAQLAVNGYTMLGGSSPKIQMKKLIGVTSANEGAGVDIVHGLSSSKILAVDVLVTDWSGNLKHAGYRLSPGFEYEYYITPTHITVYNIAGNSFYIVSAFFTILITYEQ